MKNKIKSIIKNIILLSVIIISSILIYSFAASQTYDEYQLFRNNESSPVGAIYTKDLNANAAKNIYGLNIKKPIKVGISNDPFIGDTIKKVASVSFYKDCVEVVDGKGQKSKYDWNDTAYGISYLAGQNDELTRYTSPDSKGEIYMNKISPVQAAVFRYGKNFIKSYVNTLGISVSDDCNVSGSVIPVSDSLIGTEMVNKVNEWKEMLQSEGKLNLDTGDGYNLEENYTTGGKEYIKAGPITMNCTGEIKEFNVTTQAGKKLNVEIYKYKGKSLEKTEISDAELKKGMDFYILIDKTDATNKTNLGAGNTNIKLSVKSSAGNPLKNSNEEDAQKYTSKISIYRNNTPGHQDMISLDQGPKEWSGGSEATLDLSVRYERVVRVAAYEVEDLGNGRYEETNYLVNGAKFVIRKKGTNEYVKLPADYLNALKEGKTPKLPDNYQGFEDENSQIYIYDSTKTVEGDPKEDKEIIFECENSKYITIIGLPEGEYEIEQIEIPEGYEEITDNPNATLKISFKIPFEGDDDGWYRTFNKKTKDKTIKIYKYEAKDAESKEPNKEKGILNGAIFVIRNSQGKFVRNPGANFGGVEKPENYDKENQIYTIDENDYYPKEMYDEENETYDPLVQFEIQDGKPLTIKGLKEGKYTIEEVAPPPGYSLLSWKAEFSLPDAYGHNFEFVDIPAEKGENKASISKRGLQEIYSYSETINGWYNWGSAEALRDNPDAGRGTPWGNGERIFRLLKIDPKVICDVAYEIQTNTHNFSYSPDPPVYHSPHYEKQRISCSEGCDWVYHDVITRYETIDPGIAAEYNAYVRCLGDGQFFASAQLQHMSDCAANPQDLVQEVSREQARPGDFVLNRGHSQIVKGDIQQTVTMDTSRLLGGGKFVIRNKKTNEFLRLPKKFVEARKNGLDKVGPEEGFDEETCTYYITETDYVPYEKAYNEKTRKFKDIVIFETEDGKMLNFEGLKSGEYEITEVGAPPGYTISETYIQTIEPDKDGEEASFINKSGPNGSFRKVIEGTDVGLPNFEFQLILHPIVEEYIDEINPTIYPETYQGPASDDEFKFCSGVDKVQENGRCIHNKGPEHVNTYNNERDAYNKAVTKANKYHSQRKQFVDEINTRGIVTDEDGYADLKPLTIIRDDDKGLIDIKETSVGGNPYFNLKNDDGSDRIMRLEYHKDNVMENERKRFDIEGLIWEDVRQGKRNLKNDLYDEGIEDLVHPIEVRMKKNGEEKGTGVVTDDGHYRIRFGGDKGEYLKEFLNDKTGWYIEFTYNGIVFQNVEVNLGDDYGSKAAEVPEDRDKMNADYSRIVAGTGDFSESSRGTVEYWRPPDSHTEQYKSKTRYEGNISGELSRDEGETETVGDGKYNVRKVQKIEYDQAYENPNDTTSADNCYYINSKETLEKYQMTATTEQAGYEGFEPYDVTVDRIENVNLGLYRREQPDLSVINDIYQVKVKYNGHQYTYQYGEKTSESEKGIGLNKGKVTYPDGKDIPYNQGSSFDVGVKFQDNKKFTYQREVYPSDIEIVPEEGADYGLKIYVIYKTSIFNESTSLNVNPTQIVSHYDSEYQEIKDVTNKILNPDNAENTQTVVDWNESTEFGEKPPNLGGYSKQYGTIENVISPQETMEIYTQYLLSRTECLALINHNDLKDELLFENHIEINAYTTYQGQNAYGGIDKDSHPGNMREEDEESYEDDNDEAPVFKLTRTASGNRYIEGNIFEDGILDNQEFSTGDGRGNVTERIGDGENSPGDRAIQNVIVELWEIEQNENGQIEEKHVAKLDRGDNSNTETLADGTSSNLPKAFDSGNEESINNWKFYETNLDSGEDGNRDGLENARVKTGEDGHYGFYGFTPGKYLIKYIWGQNEKVRLVNESGSEDEVELKTRIKGKNSDGTDEYITAQQYKSTIFNDQARYATYTQWQNRRFETNEGFIEELSPARWYLQGNHEGKSNGIDEFAKNDGENLAEGQRLKIDEKMENINNINNFNNFVDPEYLGKLDATNTDLSNDPGWTSESENEYNTNYGYNYKDYIGKEEYQTMYSRTPSFDIGLEELDVDDDDINGHMDGTEDHREFKIGKVDFGISERPNMDLRLRKEITKIRLILPNGQILIDADINYEENDSAGTGFTSNATGSIENTKYLQPRIATGLRDIGKFHAEMDTELIHGSTLQITYRYTISNKSELDYVLEEEDKTEGVIDKNVYFKFGIHEGTEVTMNAIKVVDYMDNKLNYDETLEDDPNNHPFGSYNQQWLRDAIETSEIVDVPGDGVDVEKGLFNKGEVFHDKESINGYAISSPDTDIGLNTTQEKVEEIKKKYTTLTRGEQDGSDRERDNGGPLLANKESEFYLTATKNLGTTTAETSYQNFAEIIKIKKTGGEYPGGNQDNDIYPKTSIYSGVVRSESEDYVDSVKGYGPGLTPGNGCPTMHIPDELDGGNAQQVTITPPTGDNSKYITAAWTIVGIISLGALGAGIIAIKKAGRTERKLR